MIVTTHQPIFLPWGGLFHKALHADALVLLDEVQFPQGRGWMSRNRLKGPQGELWLRVPVRRKGRGKQRICEVELMEEGDWRRRHLESIRQHYAHAPFLPDYLPAIEAIYARRYRLLVDFNLDLIGLLWQGLGIETRLLRQSALGVSGGKSALLVGICQALQADTYVTLSPAGKHIEPERFGAAGVQLRSLRFRPPLYPQLWGWGIYNLSALDLLLNCGPKGRELLQ